MKITERGWAGHFICSDKCKFRRNTLIENGEDRVIVSTVGAMMGKGGLQTIGAFGRYYETMAFGALDEGSYVEINVGDQREFDAEWQICADDEEQLPDDVDNLANDMHDVVVSEFVEGMKR